MKHMYLNRSLIIGSGRKDLALSRRDRCILLDHRCRNTAQSLNSEAQRRHVEQQNVGLLAAQNARLDCRSESNDLVGINRFVRLLAKETLDHFLDLWNTRGTADE